jgi:hypothetical protein
MRILYGYRYQITVHSVDHNPPCGSLSWFCLFSTSPNWRLERMEGDGGPIPTFSVFETGRDAEFAIVDY